jgi:hypothetical protein
MAAPSRVVLPNPLQGLPPESRGMMSLAIWLFEFLPDDGCLDLAVVLNSRSRWQVACKLRRDRETDCTSTNGLVAPRRVRTQIRTAQPGSIRSSGFGAIAVPWG